MVWPHRIRAVISLCIAVSIPSQVLFAEASASQEPRAATFARKLISSDHAEAIYRRLVENHWTPRTGLFRSFPDSVDLKLSQQASTYEQAAMGLLAIQFGDHDRADQLFRFFKSAWIAGPERQGPNHGMRGLCNFYNADFGTPGVEGTIHSGPNAWAGLFAATLANRNKDSDALQFALDIEYWLANTVPHQDGGIAMATHDDPYGAAWSRVYSTENNLSYYSFLTELLRSPVLDKNVRVAVTTERDHVEHWLLEVAYDSHHGKMLRGVNPGGTDSIAALDTVTWLISAIGPRRLAAHGIDPEHLMADAANTFEVRVGNQIGVDPTDQFEADRTFADLRNHPEQINRPAADRHRIVWFEGLGQYIVAWTALADYAAKSGRTAQANAYLDKAEKLTHEFDAAALQNAPAGSAYPYATPGKFYRYGWGAPKESQNGPATSLIAGVWRCFAGLGIDPLAGRSQTSVAHIVVSLPQNIQLADHGASILYGNSEDMTAEAWKALNASQWDQAIAQAEATIQEWAPQALYLQKKKGQEVGHLVEYSTASDSKVIFKYWALNDVAAAYYILGRAQDQKGNYGLALKAFQQVVTHYPLAQIWDPQGRFWSPVEAITNDYVMRDKTHYGQVRPPVFAEGSMSGKSF
jgi:tetratricopeptide (TPR) repeat protein